MPNHQFARGIFAGFGTIENPFQVPNGMEENLRLIDDHIGTYTLSSPLAPDTPYPEDAVAGNGQIYDDGSYAVLNAGAWKRYPARRGIQFTQVDGPIWQCTGNGWRVAEELVSLSAFGLTGLVIDISQKVYESGVNVMIAPRQTATIHVPAVAPSIHDALAMISGWFVFGELVIQVADGSYSNLDSIPIYHPFSDRIRVLGNVASPSSCVLSFKADGITVATGKELREINGFELRGPGAIVNGAQNIRFGLWTYGGTFAKVGNMVVDSFYYNVAALNGARIYADGTGPSNRLEARNGGDVGVWAISGSFVTCVHAYSHHNADATQPGNPLGGGFVCEFGSAIVANNAIAEENHFCGFAAQSSSSMRAWDMESRHNGHGVRSASFGSVEVFGSTIADNTWYGHYGDGCGQCFGLDQSTVTGNGLGTVKNPFYIGADTATHIDSGSLIINAGPESVAGGDTYLDVNTSATHFSIRRFLTNNVEVWREQFRRDSNTYTWGGSGVTGLLYKPTTGSIALGNNHIATTATDGFLYIPSMSGAPTGTPTPIGGWMPIVINTSDNRIEVWTGSGWKHVALS